MHPTRIAALIRAFLALLVMIIISLAAYPVYLWLRPLMDQITADDVKDFAVLAPFILFAFWMVRVILFNPGHNARTAPRATQMGPGSATAGSAGSTSIMISPGEVQHRALLRQRFPHADQTFIDAVIAVTDPQATTHALLQTARMMHRPYSRQMPTLDIQRISEHEVAHAILAHQLTLVVTGISTSGDHKGPNVAGYVDITHREDLPTQDAAYLNAMVSAAGWLQDIHEADAHDEGSMSDLTMLRNNLMIILSTDRRPSGYEGPLDEGALRAHILEQTRAILEETRAVRTELVELLRRDRSLSGRTFNTYMRQAAAQSAEPLSPTARRIIAAIDHHDQITGL